LEAGIVLFPRCEELRKVRCFLKDKPPASEAMIVQGCEGFMRSKKREIFWLPTWFWDT
jgi:hypothetical protein